MNSRAPIPPTAPGRDRRVAPRRVQPTAPSGPSLPNRGGDLLALVLFAVLAVALHPGLVFGDAGLADFDLIGYFYPYWQQRVEALRAGSLPLWNPHLFLGVPFLGNIQTGLFYPPNLPLIPFDAPRAIALSYVAHLWVAAAGMYLLARYRLRVGRAGAFLAGCVFAFGGFLAAQAGHINQVQTAVWLPALAFAYLAAHGRRSVWWVLIGGGIIALQLTAGHPQELYLSLVCIGVLALCEAVRAAVRDTEAPFNLRWPGRRWLPLRVLGWSAYGGGVLGLMGVIGAGVAAVQLLPAMELSGQGIRAGGLSYDAASAFSLAPWELLRALLPSYHEPPLSEFIVAPGCVAAALALAALLQRPWSRHTAYFLLLAITSIVLAVGNYAPWYEWVYTYLPGVGLFRVPARWLFLTAFGAAGLAGIGLDHLLSEAPRPSLRLVAVAVLVALAVVGVAVAPAWLYGSLGLLRLPGNDVVLRWLAFGVPALLLAVVGALAWRPPLLGRLLLLAALAELTLARLPMPVSHPVPASVFQTLRPGLAPLVADPDLARAMTLANPAYEPGDLKELQALYGRSLGDADVRKVVEVMKYQDILVPNTGLLHGVDTLDAYDGGLLPTQRFAAAKRQILDLTGRIPGRDVSGSEAKEAGILIRDAAGRMPDAALLGNMNLKYVVADRLADVWVDGAYHDLGLARTLQPGERLTVPLATDRPLPDGITGLSLATYLEGAAAVPADTVVATVTLTDAEGNRTSFPLRAGRETADSTTPDRAGSARAVSERRWLAGAKVYAAAFTLERPAFPRSLTVEASGTAGTSFTLAGVALLDSRTKADYSPSIDPDWARVYTGDTKVYQNRRVQPRAFIPTTVRLADSPDQQLAALPGLNGDTAVLLRDEAANGEAGATGSVQVAQYRAEQVDLDVRLDRPGYVVLRDAAYPGWSARVDGQETPIATANYLNRAVAVPAGQHRVSFGYEPTNLRIGFVISLWTGALVVVGLFFGPIVAWVAGVRGRGAPPATPTTLSPPVLRPRQPH